MVHLKKQVDYILNIYVDYMLKLKTSYMAQTGSKWDSSFDGEPKCFVKLR